MGHSFVVPMAIMVRAGEVARCAPPMVIVRVEYSMGVNRNITGILMPDAARVPPMPHVMGGRHLNVKPIISNIQMKPKPGVNPVASAGSARMEYVYTAKAGITENAKTAVQNVQPWMGDRARLWRGQIRTEIHVLFL